MQDIKKKLAEQEAERTRSTSSLLSEADTVIDSIAGCVK